MIIERKIYLDKLISKRENGLICIFNQAMSLKLYVPILVAMNCEVVALLER